MKIGPDGNLYLTVGDKHSSVESVKLEDFNGRGRYSNPEFSWLVPVAPTALVFMNSDRLGIKYQNDIFVSDIKFGNIYHFKLNKDRTQLFLGDTLENKIANSIEESQGTIFGMDLVELPILRSDLTVICMFLHMIPPMEQSTR